MLVTVVDKVSVLSGMNQRVVMKQLSNVPSKINAQQNHKFVFYMNMKASVEDDDL